MNLKKCHPKKLKTEILSAAECLPAHTIHHAARRPEVMNDNRPTCDRFTDLVENDLGKAQYIQFPTVLLFEHVGTFLQH